ncbi:GNAT family N-acetyltransferase [Nannocystis sp. RBIL2]|uniref:GNAT family N-acetyltransferase n=1 Tax=Nannocystis sp. RBIL2 TaxID=2996788 RepID=UPI00226F67D8|nr:GNAT family N-acetyltransferase [Nannocystis sp. RBIL2]
MTAVRAPETLTTARLRGARITADDGPFYRAVWQDPAVAATLGGPRTLAQIDAKIDRLLAMWPDRGYGVYTLREGDVACGYAGLAPTDAGGRESVEILYGFAPQVWRRGLATEAAIALVHLALAALRLPEVCGFTWTENLGSRRVLERAGLVYRFDFERADLPHRYYSLSRASS